MKPSDAGVDIQEITVEQLEMIRPLWEKLKTFNVQLDPQFAASRAMRAFEDRRRDWRSRSVTGGLKIDVAFGASQRLPIGYGITRLGPDGAGEIESLFVDAGHREKGIGSILMQRSLAWLDQRGAKSKVVVTAFGNGAAIGFYRKFGFFAETLSLRQVSTMHRPF